MYVLLIWGLDDVTFLRGPNFRFYPNILGKALLLVISCGSMSFGGHPSHINVHGKHKGVLPSAKLGNQASQ
jgi:hypothetical protein